MNTRKASLVLAIAAVALVPGAVAAAVPSNAATQPSTIAVIGDIPYGDAKLAAFPSEIDQINDDADVSRVVHLGDIKNGSSPCSDAYFATIKSEFDSFQRPLIYTPGDNEWTDCHRPADGGYWPDDRLAALRTTFFPSPGYTLGRAVSIDTQASDTEHAAFVENTMWTQSGVVFAAVNIPGSDNDLVPWFGVTPLARRQRDEYDARLDADLAWITEAFNRARRTGAAGVGLLFQADMWDTSAIGGDGLDGIDRIVARIATLAAHFDGQVLLLEGDSHVYRVDHPFVTSDPLYQIHPLTPRTLQAPNVTRVVVDGSGNANDYLRLSVDPATPTVFTWTRVPFSA